MSWKMQKCNVQLRGPAELGDTLHLVIWPTADKEIDCSFKLLYKA